MVEHTNATRRSRLGQRSEIPPAPIPLQGETSYVESMARGMVEQLQQRGIGQSVDFTGFQDAVVADIGARDGRFVSVFKKLGAKRVIAIEPDAYELKKAVDGGLVSKKNAKRGKLEEIVKGSRTPVDVAAVLNFNIPLAERNDFIRALGKILKPDGAVFITSAEKHTHSDIESRLQAANYRVESQVLWDDTSIEDGSFPHKYVLVGKKRK